MHSSYRTLDHLMYNNGGCDPFHHFAGCGLGFVSYKNKFNTKYHLPKEESHTLKEIAELTGFKKSGLQTIYNKGIGAWHTNPQSVRPQVKSKEQWAMARVYAAINPTSKAYRIDKGHLIKGGMVFDLPSNKLSDENILINKANIDLNTTDIDDLVHSYSYLAQTVGGKDFDKRINWLVEKINDIDDIEKTEKNKGIIDLNFDEDEKGYMTNIKANADRLAIFDANRLAVDKVLSNYAKEGKYKLGGKEHTNIKAKVSEFEEEYPEENPIFKEYHKEAKKDIKTGKYPTDTVDTRRGDISEEFSVNNDELTRQFRNIDTNDSPLYNSKDDTPYTGEFLDIISPDWTPTTAKEIKQYNKEITKELGFFPIDGIKTGTSDYGTLWELKSYSAPLEEKGGKQKLSLSKIEGKAGYKIKYKKNGNDFVIENVYYKNIPTLPYKPLGYNYFWAFDNKDRIGYANPLTKKAGFRPIKNEDGTYNGSWDNDEVYGSDLYINNKDIKIYPKSYYKTFKEKRINK